MKLTYIGHSTVLFEHDGRAILTDPIFSSEIFFIKRLKELKYDPATLPPLTAVLISHTHYDHLDLESFNYFPTDIPIVVPEGSGKKVAHFFPNPVIELSHWSEHNFGGGLKIHAMPAAHSGGRIFPHFYKNAAGYMIETGSKVVYFAGDTSYGTHFRDIGATFSIDAALLPIGCYRPAFFMKRFHMDPADALQALIDLKAKCMIPIHWGAFRLSLEKPTEPIEWLKRAAKERELEDGVKILESGQSLEI